LLLFSALSTFADAGPALAQHTTYGSLWEVGPGVTTELLLEGTGKSLPVTVTLYSSTGEPLATSTAYVKSQGVTRLSLSSLVAQVGATKEGGLSLAWTGGTTDVRCRVQVNRDDGINASYLPRGGYRAHTKNALFAPWYLPDGGSSGQIRLFDSGPSAIGVEVDLVISGVEKKMRALTIQPNATQTVDLRSLLSEASAGGTTAGSVVLRYTGPSHSLQPSMFLSNSGTGFSLIPEFSPVLAAGTAGETVWQFPSILTPANASASPASDASMAATSYALISNGSSHAVTVIFKAYAVQGNKTVQGDLNPSSLEPYQTSLVPLAGVSGLAATSAGFGLMVTHSGSAGTLAMSVFSVDRTGRTLATSSGLVVPAASPEVAFWSSSTRPTVHYAVDSPGGVSPSVTLYYQSQFGVDRYTFPQQQANDGGSHLQFTLPAPRSSPKDGQGNVILGGVSSGLLVLSTNPQNAQQIAANQPNCAADCNEEPTATVAAEAPAASQVAFVKPDVADSCECHAQIFYRYVYRGPINTFQNHTFWQLIDYYGYNHVIDAGPSGNCLPHCGNLIAWEYMGHIGYYKEDNSQTAHFLWKGADVDGVRKLFDYYQDWPNVTGLPSIPYDPTNGPNSNTYIHWSAEYAKLNVDKTPPSAPGWDY
jgi:hypothetical protein